MNDIIGNDGLNPYFIGLPILITLKSTLGYFDKNRLNPYFIGLPILIVVIIDGIITVIRSLNPYFIGLPILIHNSRVPKEKYPMSQSLFYWITYSYHCIQTFTTLCVQCLNPYFIGLPILISRLSVEERLENESQSLFYWITYSYNQSPFKCSLPVVSILILLDYLFLYSPNLA